MISGVFAVVENVAAAKESSAQSLEADLLLSPIAELVTPWVDALPARGSAMQSVRRIQNAALAVRSGKISFVGTAEEAAREVRTGAHTRVLDCSKRLVTPGLVDPHTHLIFSGNRANEFVMRCQGKSYAEIANAGGGILASMKATRSASQDELVSLAQKRLQRMLEHGTTTVEVKTGYGLDRESELNMLSAIFALVEKSSIDIVPTFMPAHAVPPGKDREGYVNEIIADMLPAAQKLWQQCSPQVKRRLPHVFADVFCDEGYFTLEDTRRIFDHARQCGFSLKVHADEFANLGASRLATEYGAASVDHVLQISDEEIALLSKCDTVAVLLPGTSFYLNLQEHAPARKMIASGVAVALGSDYNPGSCHIFSLPMILALACLHLRMTPEEALTALTVNAACAIGRGDQVGMLRVGYQADIAVYDVATLEEVPYNIGLNTIAGVIKSGALVVSDNLTC